MGQVIRQQENSFHQSYVGQFLSQVEYLIDEISNGQAITSVYAASSGDVNQAVRHARAAFEKGPWHDLSPTERGRLLLKLAEIVERDREILATIETWDNGKPYSVALEEDLTEVAEVLRYYAGWADKTYGSVIDTTSAKFAYTIREPLGVCGQIIPYVLKSKHCK